MSSDDPTPVNGTPVTDEDLVAQSRHQAHANAKLRAGVESFRLARATLHDGLEAVKGLVEPAIAAAAKAAIDALVASAEKSLR